MARVTVEDCLERVPNRFALTVLAARRARELSEGHGSALVDCDNKEAVTALREVSAENVRFTESVDEAIANYINDQRRTFMRSVDGDHTFLDAASFSMGAVTSPDDGVVEDEDEEDTGVKELSGDLTKVALEDADDAEEDTGELEGVSTDSDEGEDEDAAGVDVAVPGTDDDDSDDDKSDADA